MLIIPRSLSSPFRSFVFNTPALPQFSKCHHSLLKPETWNVSMIPLSSSLLTCWLNPVKSTFKTPLKFFNFSQSPLWHLLSFPRPPSFLAWATKHYPLTGLPSFTLAFPWVLLYVSRPISLKCKPVDALLLLKTPLAVRIMSKYSFIVCKALQCLLLVIDWLFL